MGIRANKYEMGRKTHFLTLLAQGKGPGQANRIVKQMSSADEFERKGIRPEVANRWSHAFARERALSTSQLPTRRSDWFSAGNAVDLGWKSNTEFKYTLRYSFEYFDPNTQTWNSTIRSMGLYRMDRWGNIKDMAAEMVRKMQSQQSDQYGFKRWDIDFDSIKPELLIRTG